MHGGSGGRRHTAQGRGFSEAPAIGTCVCVCVEIHKDTVQKDSRLVLHATGPWLGFWPMAVEQVLAHGTLHEDALGLLVITWGRIRQNLLRA